MCFQAALYKRYMARLRSAGIDIPVIPGIRPVSRAEHVRAAEEVFGAAVPAHLKKALRAASRERGREICIEFTVRLCEDLAGLGAPGVHLFILNDVELAKEIIAPVREAMG